MKKTNGPDLSSIGVRLLALIARKLGIDYLGRVGHIRAMKKTVVREFVVKALWDEQARVWVATSDDVTGLVTESKTFEALLKKLRALVPELLELNGAMPRSGRAPYRVVAERHEDVQAAE